MKRLIPALGVALGLYSAFVEPRWFALRRHTLRVLEPGEPAIRVLHLSDLHLVPGQQHKIRWVSKLAGLRPDVVINTGDTLSHPAAVATAAQALSVFDGTPAAFVYGNNDFWAPVLKSPHLYFTGGTVQRPRTELPWRELGAMLRQRGWLDLNNRRGELTVGRRCIAVGGVDDPHLSRDRYRAIAGLADPTAAVRLGVMHTPEPRVLDLLAADGYDLTLAGHTHGGQVRVPGVGALVTNCNIDRSRARGLSRWGASMYLNISAGAGTSPYAPIRFCCRPEASLLTLVGRERG